MVVTANLQHSSSTLLLQYMLSYQIYDALV